MLRKALLVVPLLLIVGIVPAPAQSRRQYNRYNNDRNGNFYNGVRDGGRGGDYYDSNRDRRYNYNRDQYDRNRQQGGIGPGKGALIGAGGGAVLGALFGRSLKGTLIGGAAGAGIGAIVGEVHQKHQRNQRYRR